MIDIEQYRAQIGSHASFMAAKMAKEMKDKFMAAEVIETLLLIAGIEPNPGPGI